MSRRNLRPALAIAAFVALLAGQAHSQAAGEAAIAERQAKFRAMAAAFNGLNVELRKLDPDLAAVRAATKQVSHAAAELPTWFPNGSGPEAGKTRAKAEIWQSPAAFESFSKSFKAEAAKLDALAAGDDIDAITLQAKAIGAECAQCHTDLRAAAQ